MCHFRSQYLDLKSELAMKSSSSTVAAMPCYSPKLLLGKLAGGACGMVVDGGDGRRLRCTAVSNGAPVPKPLLLLIPVVRSDHLGAKSQRLVVGLSGCGTDDGEGIPRHQLVGEEIAADDGRQTQ